jgi:hypothetical protein
MVKRAAALFEAGSPCGPEANMANLLAANAGCTLSAFLSGVKLQSVTKGKSSALPV